MPAMSSRDKYTDPDPANLQFAIIPVVTPPTNAIAHGSLNAVMEHVIDSQVRSDAEDLLAAAAQPVGSLETTQSQHNQILARSIQALNDTIEHLTWRIDAFEEQENARLKADAEAKARRDAEAKAAQIKAALDTLEEYQGGELTVHPPS